MKCQILFSGTNEKNISKCHLLESLPRVLSVKILSGIANSVHPDQTAPRSSLI